MFSDEKRGNPYIVPPNTFFFFIIIIIISCLDQIWNIFSKYFVKKEEISWSEENFHLCKK